MPKINTHGLKMVGLKTTAGSTGTYATCSGLYDEIFYNRKTGEVWNVSQCSLGYFKETKYADQDIIKICNSTDRMTMQEIADEIFRKVMAMHGVIS